MINIFYQLQFALKNDNSNLKQKFFNPLVDGTEILKN